MDGWNKLQAGLTGLKLGDSAKGFAKGFSSSVQATRERLGQVAPDEITELPQEYKDLEARVDALRNAHLNILKIARVYETETYDYPTQVQESISELSSNISHTLTTFANTNLKGTNLPLPQPTPQPIHPHKTLPHALARASAAGAAAIGNDRLGKALAEYAVAQEKIGKARVVQDEQIRAAFLGPWSATLNSSIAVAIKARQAVRASRLELDAAKQTLKNANPARQEQARLEVENAEDDLVQKTEVAITLMKTVLENPEPIKNINELAKAQLAYHAAVAEALQASQGEIDELSIAAEGEYRKSRDH
ncbi:BAR domain-containing family protein [Hysterangium stoloniferum]|nr:BAR domain-containing family protein [Hysterangium stoloniferum]